MLSLIVKFSKNESGSTAIEYGLIAALVSIVLVSPLLAQNKKIVAAYTKFQSEITGGLNPVANVGFVDSAASN